MKKIVLLVAAAVAGYAPAVFSSGYRIPEQSLNATALGSANVAAAMNADAAYYNPANMSWMENTFSVEGGVNYIFLPSITYTDSRSAAFNGDSESEHFFIPTLFLVSRDFNNFRFGYAMIFPAGLSKKWQDPYPRTFAEEFSMTSAEANPTVSYRFGDRISAAAGLRMVYSDATVKSRGTVTAVPAGGLGGGLPSTSEYTTLSRDLDGQATEFGYNLALSIRPTDSINLAATYRSKIDLELDGDGILTASPSFPSGIIPGHSYRGSGTVSIPIPAILTLAVSYTFDRATFEFGYDRTFWSDYGEIDVNYSRSLDHPVLTAAFDDPVEKNWDDVNAYRLGLTYAWNDKLTLMAGIGIDGNPIPDATLSFDLPDADAWFASAGFRYRLNDSWSLGAAYLHAQKDDRAVVNDTIHGEFTDNATHMLALSAAYRF